MMVGRILMEMSETIRKNERSWRQTVIHLDRQSPMRIAILLLVAALLAACGRPAPQPLTFVAAPWGAGEVSEYQITDVNGQPAGVTRFEIGRSEDEANDGGWSIRRETLAQGANEVVEVEITTGMRPLTSLLMRSAGANQGAERVMAAYDRGQVQMELTTSRNVTTYERASIPSDARDGNLLPVVVRALPLSEGYATRIHSFLPVVGQLETFTVSVLGMEEVNVPAGVFQAYKVEMSARNYKTTAWYADDPERTLVKYIDGRNRGTFELAVFQPGN